MGFEIFLLVFRSLLICGSSGAALSLGGYILLYAITVSYPDESPDATPREAEKVKFVE